MVSPTTLIRDRRGNSFEIATLLCSMLIGAGYPAMVVSGSARIETVTNDQRNIEYPLPEDKDLTYDIEAGADMERFEISDKYKLKPKPDLTSHLAEKLEKRQKEREKREKAEREEAARLEREAFEEEVALNDPNRMSHAWVMIVNNAPWSIKPRSKILDEEGEEIDAPPSVTFIEPSTGFLHDTNNKGYVHIESVWNNMNYYVNLQKCRIYEMKWDLRNTSDWEHFLAGEPSEMRVIEEVSDENLLEEVNKIDVEKHLDMTRSWVQKLQITEKEIDERYPNHHKAIYYKNVLHERFSSHYKSDGTVEQLTLFSDRHHEVPEIRWTWYNSRADLQIRGKYTYSTGQTEEHFLKGRGDSLKYLIYNKDSTKPKILHFFSTPRPDNLRYCEVHENEVIAHFERIAGQCYHREFVTKKGKLKEITEKFHRDPSKPAYKDIATCNFLLYQNKIVLKFHYARGALTAAVREFIKPPKPDYGQEIIFDPAFTKGWRYGGSEAEPTQLELYLLLLSQLRAEENSKKRYDKLLEELNDIFELRKRERRHTILRIKCFDPLRNAAARELRVEKEKAEEEVKKDRATNPPDFLAPYLVAYMGRPLTAKESWDVYHTCLNDMKNRFVSLLNELQRRYEDLTAEAQSLKKFLNKFQNKFDDFDYERLLQESKDLELNKRMVQKRLTITHEEAQKKYDMVKQSLLKDRRLNLKTPASE